MAPEQVARRRVSDHRLQSIADNALLRVSVSVLTAVGVPLMLWGLTSLVDRVAKVEAGMYGVVSQDREWRYRMEQLEKSQQDLLGAQKALAQMVTANDLEIRLLKSRMK